LEPLYKRLKRERMNSGLNQEDFATLGGVSVQSQRNYESGRRSPDTEYLERISNAVDVGYIISGKRDFEVREDAPDYHDEGKKQIAYDPVVGAKAGEIAEVLIGHFEMNEDKKHAVAPFVYSLLMVGNYGSTAEDMIKMLRDLGWPERQLDETGS